MGKMSRAQSPEPEGPKPIHRLQEQLINRIAAGEVMPYLEMIRILLNFATDHPQAGFSAERAS